MNFERVLTAEIAVDQPKEVVAYQIELLKKEISDMEEFEDVESLQRDLKFLLKPLHKKEELQDLEKIQHLLISLLNHFFAVREQNFKDLGERRIMNYDIYYDEARVEYSYFLAYSCKYAAAIKEVQNIKHDQSLEMIKSFTRKDEIEKFLDWLEKNDNWWHKPIFAFDNLQTGIEKFLFKETIKINNLAKELLEKFEDEKRGEKESKGFAEKSVEEVEKLIVTELQIQKTMEDLIEKHPDKEKFLRKRFRIIIDELREKS